MILVLVLDANFGKKNPGTLCLQSRGQPNRSDGTWWRGQNQSDYFSLLRGEKSDGTRLPIVVDDEFERVPFGVIGLSMKVDGSVEAIWLVLLAAAKFADLVDKKI
jgi:hypothetical protein